MKIIILVISNILVTGMLMSQIEQFNNFEKEQNLPVEIGETKMDSLWQIGTPQKSLFSEAFSFPNALVTDTLQTYPSDHTSSFIFELNNLYKFPFIQFEWFQYTDFEDSGDGGYIEASYDNGLSWSNVLSDTIFRPFVVGNYQAGELINGETGFVGTTPWSWVAICWGSHIGTLPTDLTNILIKYTFVSDENDTRQDGWMLDDFSYISGIIGNTSNEKTGIPIHTFPNPTNDELILDMKEISQMTVELEIYNMAGQIKLSKSIQNISSHYTLNTSSLLAGQYLLILKEKDNLYTQQFIITK